MAQETEEVKTEEGALKPPESGADFNLVEDTIYKRRSVRVYRKKQVPDYLVRRILETARFAPSAGNGQSWKFIVVRDAGMLEEMSGDIVKMCKKMKKFADYLAPGQEKKEWRAKAMMRLAPNMFHPIPFGATIFIAEGKLGVWHGAPTVILLLGDSRSPGSPPIDLGIAGQNMVLTAHSYGLGTCWVSFSKVLDGNKKWKKRLGIRYPYKLHTSLAIGFPRGTPDGYVKRETAAIDWYDEGGELKVLY